MTTPLRIAVCVFVVVLLVPAAWAEDVAEKPVLVSNVFVDTSIRAALSDLALASGYTIIPDSTLEGIVSLELRDVPFQEALRRVCLGVGAVYREVSPGVWLVGSSSPTSPTFDELAVTQVVRLNYLTTEEVYQQIPTTFQPYVRQGIDQVVVTAPSPLLEQIVALLAQIDPVSYTHLTLPTIYSV